MVAEEYGLSNLQMKRKPYYFEFEYDGHTVKCIYEKKFEFGSRHAWAVTSTPDFTVMVNGDIIAVFDAKNYAVDSEGKTEAKNKMLAYLTNLD